MKKIIRIIVKNKKTGAIKDVFETTYMTTKRGYIANHICQIIDKALEIDGNVKIRVIRKELGL